MKLRYFFIFNVFLLINLTCLLGARASQLVTFVAKPIHEFVTASDNLPSNALGVLFEYRFGAVNTVKLGKTYYYLLNHRPEILGANNFLAQESNREISVTLKKMNIRQNYENNSFLVIYVPDIELYQCLINREQKKQLDSKCDLVLMSLTTEDDLASLIKNGKVENVSDSFHDAQGLFRIEPTLGFKAGTEYTFKYISSKNAVENLIKHSKTVHIDTSSMRFESEDLTLVSGESRLEGNVYSLPVSFRLPAGIEKYRDLISYQIQQRFLNQDFSIDEIQNQSNHDSAVWYGPGVYNATTRIQVQCSNYRDAPRGYVQIQGKLNVLEVSDTVFLTPVVTIDIDFANRPACVPTLVNSPAGGWLPEQWISFDDDLSLCSITNDMPKIWISEFGFSPYYGAPKVGGAVYSSEKLLNLLLNTPLRNDGGTYPACYFGALAKTAWGNYDVETVQKVFTKFISLYEYKHWQLDPGTDRSERYFVEYLKELRQHIDTRFGMVHQKSDVEIFSPVAKAFAKNVNSENIRSVKTVFKVLGRGALDAIPLLLSVDNALEEKYKLELLLLIAPSDPLVVKAFLSLNNGDDYALLRLLVPHVKAITDTELLVYITEHTSNVDLILEAFNTIFLINKNDQRMGNKLISFAKNNFSKSGAKEFNASQKEKLFRLLISLKNRDQELINLFLSFDDGTFDALSQMGIRAQPAATLLLEKFRCIESFYYFERLVDTMKTIQAKKSLFRRAYQLAQKSPELNVRRAAKKALQHLSE